MLKYFFTWFWDLWSKSNTTKPIVEYNTTHERWEVTDYKRNEL